MTDDELLAALRDGDDHAYEVLWVRHVAVARRVAARLAPTQPDDLVSEAFLTIFDQVRIAGKGPTEAFRPYLLAVVRNIAARWHREGTHLVLDPDLDPIVDADAARTMEDEYDAALVLEAFRALPERWQRVLWLTEVESTRRPVIAADLGLRPNAVSALHRRARRGLRVQWLQQQIPADLRGDAHVGDLLAEQIVEGPRALAPAIGGHLGECERCRLLDGDLRAAYRRGTRTLASLGGLAALGVVIPTASSAVTAPAAVAATAGLIAAAAALILGGIGVGVGLTVDALTPRSVPEVVAASPPKVATSERPAAAPVLPALTTPAPAVEPAPAVPVIPRPAPSTPPEIDIFFDPALAPGMPERPAPASPVEPGTAAPPSEGSDAAPAPAFTATTPSSTYLAPVLAGEAPEGSAVYVAVADQTYEAPPADDGTWSFDLRMVPLTAGTHTATIWTVTDGVASSAAEATFTIEAVVNDGLEGYPSVTLRDGMDAGLPFTLVGPPSGTVCIDSDTGQSATIALDGTGSAARVLRFYNYGTYVLRLTVCDGERFGPDSLVSVAVTNGIFDPWVLDDVMWWEISEE